MNFLKSLHNSPAWAKVAAWTGAALYALTKANLLGKYSALGEGIAFMLGASAAHTASNTSKVN